MIGRHNAALLHRVIQKRQCGGGAVGPADLQAHFLKDPGHAVPGCWGGCQRKVHDSEGNMQALGCFLPHQLPHAGDAERRLFHRFRHHIEGLALHILQRVIDYARAGNAHIQHTFRLSHAVECAGHKGIVLHGIGKNHQLSAPQPLVIRGQLGGPLDDAPHFRHGIHIDARFGGSDVYAGADSLGGRHRLRNRADQLPISLRAALLHQGGKSADKVHAALLRRSIQRLGDWDIGIGLAGPGHQGDRRHRNALIHNGNTEFPLQILANLHQVPGTAGDFPVNFLTAALYIRVTAIQQADTHGDGADIQVALVDHILGLQNIILIQHSNSSDPMHGFKNILPLYADGQAHFLAGFLHCGAKLPQRQGAF